MMPQHSQPQPGMSRLREPIRPKPFYQPKKLKSASRVVLDERCWCVLEPLDKPYLEVLTDSEANHQAIYSPLMSRRPPFASWLLLRHVKSVWRRVTYMSPQV